MALLGSVDDATRPLTVVRFLQVSVRVLPLTLLAAEDLAVFTPQARGSAAVAWVLPKRLGKWYEDFLLW